MASAAIWSRRSITTSPRWRPSRSTRATTRPLPSPQPPQPDQPGLDAEERLQKAFELSFAYLNRRERTIDEVRRRLEQKGVSPSTADAAVETLVQDGYLDDSRYALMFVHDKRELEGWGSERIRRALTERGIDRDSIEAALQQHEAEWGRDETELDRAVALLRRRFPSPPRERRERDRALGVLIRKGFESELAVDALAAYSRQA